MLKNIHFRYILIILLLLGYIFLQRSCTNSYTPDKQIIVTEAKKGSFNSIKPEVIKVPEYKYITLKGDTITLDNPIDKQLAQKYERERDSLKRRLMFYDAIQMRKYGGKFENKDLLINFEAYTTGTLDSLSIPSYVIKSDTIELSKPKETKFALYLGGGLYNNSNFNNTGFKVNLGIQNKKGDIFRGSYDPFNKNYFVDYDVRIFNYKK